MLQMVGCGIIVDHSVHYRYHETSISGSGHFDEVGSG